MGENNFSSNSAIFSHMRARIPLLSYTLPTANIWQEACFLWGGGGVLIITICTNAGTGNIKRSLPASSEISLIKFFLRGNLNIDRKGATGKRLAQNL